jgi:anti-sigma factor RsiW
VKVDERSAALPGRLALVAYHPEAFGCESVRLEVSELLDGELDAHESARIGLHVASCRACARFAAELALVVCALRQLPEAARRALGARAHAQAFTASR